MRQQELERERDPQAEEKRQWLEKEPDNRLSYFFCQATEARLSNATAVLRGLIYLLVDQQPSLTSHVRKKHDHAGKQLFKDGNAWEALSKILAAMLNDPSLDSAILIVNALDECKTNRHQLLDLIAKASRVKWIVSSRNWWDIKEKMGNIKQKVRLYLELNKDSISMAVDTYIAYKVDRLACHKKYDKETRDTVEQHLVSGANDTFLWVALVCQELQTTDFWDVLDAIGKIPAGLSMGMPAAPFGIELICPRLGRGAGPSVLQLREPNTAHKKMIFSSS
ncbi:hypothetical protein EDB81DRAFT_699461 [Dactylonectria macrodidyma]|uniref:Nephrocystin 3-like N-terminal domain-containing protein n=1 Tax=Dactylonectria macrodidyma TaxID=307937 RepID=A0A9P9DTW3_9HYPO|nr:hypothetical protein EDB81DRAFT_699461 [Dactylonectria macrodidyma]